MFRKLLFFKIIVITLLFVVKLYADSSYSNKLELHEAASNTFRHDLAYKKNSNSNSNNSNNSNSKKIDSTNSNNSNNSNSYKNKLIFNKDNKPILKYNSNGKFKIVQFTDLHYGEGEVNDNMNLKNQETILEIEKPDFVMLSGDVISGYNYHRRENYTQVWNKLTKPMIKRNIPWSITFGNHDCEGILTCKQIATIDKNFSLSLTEINRMIDIPGITNYQLNIFSSDYNGDGTDIENSESLIYVFDSDTIGCRESEAWGCIHKQQVDWYRNLSNSNNRKDAIAFVHIPPNDVIDLWNNGIVYGDFGDTSSCCYYTDQSKFVETLIQQGDVKGLYFGHDHKNDFYGDYYGVSLGYGRKSGYGSYNPKYLEGARILELDSNPFKINTWIRDSSGNIDPQKIHKPSRFSQLPNYCSKPGEPVEGPWVLFLVVFVVCCLVLAFLRLKSHGYSSVSIEFKPVQNQ